MKPYKQHIIPFGLLSAVVLVYPKSFLDCETTPPLCGVCPRCSYRAAGKESGFQIYFYYVFLSLSHFL